MVKQTKASRTQQEKENHAPHFQSLIKPNSLTTVILYLYKKAFVSRFFKNKKKEESSN